MDSKGYDTINGVLTEARLHAFIRPHPAEGEHAEFLTIVTDSVIAGPALVLNALAKANLLSRQIDANRAKQGPKLMPLFGDSISVTLEDMNNGH